MCESPGSPGGRWSGLELADTLLYFLIPWAGNLTSNIYPRDGNLTGFVRKYQFPGGLPALPTVPETIDRCIIRTVEIKGLCLQLKRSGTEYAAQKINFLTSAVANDLRSEVGRKPENCHFFITEGHKKDCFSRSIKYI